MKKTANSGDSRLTKEQKALLTAKGSAASGPPGGGGPPRRPRGGRGGGGGGGRGPRGVPSTLVAQAAGGLLADHVKDQRAFVKIKDSNNKPIRMPRFAWPLPQWTGGPSSPPTLVDNVTALPQFANRGPLTHLYSVTGFPVTDLDTRMADVKARYPYKPDPTKPPRFNPVTINRQVETVVGQDTNEPLIKAPHPDSDFSHVDTGTYDAAEKKQILDAVTTMENLETLASKDGELAGNIGQGNKPLANVRALLAANPRGMQRLKLVFEWTVCQVIIIFGEINMALDDGDRDKYRDALKNYIELLRDLDDHDPHTHPSGPPVPGRRGYGITIKWPSILPLILGGRIQGAIVEVKWNPHESSSGIPIPHG